MKDRNYRQNFQPGIGVYNCIICKRRTRGDGDSHQCELCGQCMNLAEWDNHHNDCAELPTPDEMREYRNLRDEAVRLGGDKDRIEGLNDYIFNEDTEGM